MNIKKIKNDMSKWEMARLGEYVNIQTGKLDANASSENGEYPFFTCSREPLKINTYGYDCECALVAGNGDLNVKYYNGKFEAYQRTYIVESKNKDRLNVLYLYNFLDSCLERLREESVGGVIKYIKLGNLTNAKIPLPPLETQKKIADELDKISGLIEMKKKQIEKLDLLVKAKFVEMFGDPVRNEMGWIVKELSLVADIKIGPFGSLLHKEDYVLNQHALVNPSHIINGEIIVDNRLTVTDIKYDELNAYHLKIDDIVLGRRGEMGRCAVVKETGLLCGTGSIIVRCKKAIIPLILQRMISFPTFRKSIENSSVGVTMQNLNVPIVSKFLIPCPSIALQNQFADYLEKVEKSKEDIRKGLEQLERLYKERMQEYFG